jgi:hypothetical protein
MHQVLINWINPKGISAAGVGNLVKCDRIDIIQVPSCANSDPMPFCDRIAAGSILNNNFLVSRTRGDCQHGDIA